MKHKKDYQTIPIRWDSGRKSQLLIDGNRIKYKGRWYEYKNWRNDHYRTTASTISFILLNVPCNSNRRFPWDHLFFCEDILLPCSYKVTFYWDGEYWRYQSGYITGPIDLSVQFYYKEELRKMGY